MSEQKKVSLQDAMKKMLEQKQQAQNGKNKVGGIVKSTKSMSSQLTKKPNNQKRRTGV